MVIPSHLARFTYSRLGKADVTLKEVLHQGLDGTEIVMAAAGREIRTKVPLPGMHNVVNALAAAACALSLGIDHEKISRGIADARFPGMRSEVIVHRGVSIINDSYNANPASMKAALEVLVESPNTYRVAVLGDMLELGKEAEHWHAELGKWVAKAGVDRLVVTGEMARTVADEALRQGMDPHSVRIALNHEDILGHLLDVLDRDAAVLVKASRGLHLDDVVTRLKAVG